MEDSSQFENQTGYLEQDDFFLSCSRKKLPVSKAEKYVISNVPCCGFVTMKIQTFFYTCLLLLTFQLTACRSASPDKAPATVEEAEKQLAKKRKKEAKASKRELRKAKKEFWKRQSKTARKSVKKNARRQRKIERQKKRQGEYNWEDQKRWEGMR